MIILLLLPLQSVHHYKFMLKLPPCFIGTIINLSEACALLQNQAPWHCSLTKKNKIFEDKMIGFYLR